MQPKPSLVIKFAFLASILIYQGVAFFVIQSASKDYKTTDISILFPVLAIAFAVGCFVLEPIISAQNLKRHGRYEKSAMIVRLAFYQAGAIYGLLLSFLTLDINYALGFGVLSFFLILTRVPIPEE